MQCILKDMVSEAAGEPTKLTPFVFSSFFLLFLLLTMSFITRTERCLEDSGISVAPPERPHAALSTIPPAPDHVTSTRRCRADTSKLANNTQVPNNTHMANNTKTAEFTQTPTNEGNADEPWNVTNAGNTKDSKAMNTTDGNTKDTSSTVTSVPAPRTFVGSPKLFRRYFT